DRLIDAEAVAHILERFLACLIAKNRLRRIARQDARQHEDDREDGEQRRDGEEQALDDVTEHRGFTRRLPPTPTLPRKGGGGSEGQSQAIPSPLEGEG